MKPVIQAKLSSTSASIWKLPIASSDVKPCIMLRIIRSAWTCWAGSSR